MDTVFNIIACNGHISIYRVVGILLVSALITLPIAIAMRMTKVSNNLLY